MSSGQVIILSNFALDFDTIFFINMIGSLKTSSGMNLNRS